MDMNFPEILNWAYTIYEQISKNGHIYPNCKCEFSHDLRHISLMFSTLQTAAAHSATFDYSNRIFQINNTDISSNHQKALYDAFKPFHYGYNYTLNNLNDTFDDVHADNSTLTLTVIVAGRTFTISFDNINAFDMFGSGKILTPEHELYEFDEYKSIERIFVSKKVETARTGG